MNKTDQMRQEAPRPIQIVIGYEWEQSADGQMKSVREDLRWNKLRGLIFKIAKSFSEQETKNKNTRYPIQIRINRLRARHGSYLLREIHNRVGKADILIFDLGSERAGRPNPNVLIELGIALGMGKGDYGGLYILKPENIEWPSDISGFFYTGYDSASINAEELKLQDALGFGAALRATLRELARDRGMLGFEERISVTFDDHDS